MNELHTDSEYRDYVAQMDVAGSFSGVDLQEFKHPTRRPGQHVVTQLANRYRNVCVIWDAVQNRWVLCELTNCVTGVYDVYGTTLEVVERVPRRICVLENKDGSFVNLHEWDRRIDDFLHDNLLLEKMLGAYNDPFMAHRRATQETRKILQKIGDKRDKTREEMRYVFHEGASVLRKKSFSMTGKRS